MRVLQVCLSHHFGGMERFAATLAANLGHELNCSFLARGGTELAAHARTMGLPLHTLDYRFPKFAPLAILELHRLLLREGIDLLHFHGASELALIVPALLGLPHVALVVHRHIHVGKAKDSFYHRWVYGRVDLALAPSESVRRNTARHFPIPEGKIRVLPHALRLEDFEGGGELPSLLAEPRQAGAGRPFVCTVSRLARGKGVDRFIRAARLLSRGAAETGRPRPLFFVIGAGEGDYEAELRSLAKGSEDIVFTGNRDDVSRLLPHMDLFCSFTEGEAFGLSVLEAMASRIRILAMDVSGPRELLEGHPTDLCDPRLDDAALAEAMARRLERPPEKHDLQPYSQERYMGRMVALLEEAQAARKPR